MSANAPKLDNPLDSAIDQLHGICRDRELLQSSIDAGSLRRMAVHITSINFAVLASTEDHVNAAKRLNDFAFTLARVAKNSDPPNETLTARMTSIANILRTVSAELSGSDTIPNWRAPSSELIAKAQDIVPGPGP